MILTAVVPYALPCYLVAAGTFALLRRRAPTAPRRWYGAAALLALAGVVLHAVLLAPAFLGSHASGQPDLVLMTLNLRKGGADATEVVRVVRERRVDVLVLEEVTPKARAGLARAGLDTLLPHTAGSPVPGTAGMMLFADVELTAAEPIASRNGAYRVRVGTPEPFWLVGVHTSQPLARPAEWAKDWRAIHAAVRALDGDRVVAGDFNATLDHRPVRDLLGLGLTDAARQANSGWQPTWPSLGFPFALIAVDHVLVPPGLDTTATWTPHVRGTDHRALVVGLRRR